MLVAGKQQARKRQVRREKPGRQGKPLPCLFKRQLPSKGYREINIPN